MAEFPYRCEYAKSSRAACKGCKIKIDKEELRLAVMVQSRHFDGKQPNWFHFKCFFEKQRPKTTDDIEHFDSMRWQDQEKIKNQIANPSAASAESGTKKKGRKRKSEVATTTIGLNDFKVENAKSSRAKCRGCENIILKNEVRIAKKDFESEIGKMYGGQDMWHHLDCFVKLRNQLEFWDDGKALPGFTSLSEEHQKSVSKSLPKITPVAVKIEKNDEDGEPPANKIVKSDVDEKKLKEQNKILYKYKDQLKDNLNKNELTELLHFNDRSIPVGTERIIDILGDLITFGVPVPCSECSGELVYSSGIGYKCTGDLTEWSKCTKVFVDPKKTKFKIPNDLKQDYSFLNSYKYVPRKRLFKTINPTNVVKKEETDTGPLVKRDALPLENMKFCIIGKTGSSKASLKETISKLGGRVVTTVSEAVTAVISTKDEIEDKSPQMSLAEDLKIHVIEEDVLKEIKKTKSKIVDLIVEKSICNWGSEIEKRIEKSMPSKSNKSKSIFTKSVPSSQKLTLKGGLAVDPDSNLEDVAHVLKDDGNVYNAVLGVTDLQTNKNSYYKLQVLEADKSSRYWLFRSWGRIGTNIGGSKVEDMSSKMNAIANFKTIYEEKTGNDWCDRDNFIKIPHKFYPVDVEYDESDNAGNQFDSNIPSLLPKSVQQLVKLLFDINTMKRVMKEFELDLDKMPLGKLSQKQLQKAFGVLTEIQNLLKSSGPESRFIDASNRFYTLVPHSFGVDSLPLIKTEEQIKEKIEMLNSLMDISIAYSLIKGEDSKEANPIDKNYEKLQTDIEPLDKNTDEFKLLQKYVDNTHAATHQSYKLVIEEVFKIKRQNEEKRYKPFKKLPNKKLLWHGSRLTNYAGILSQGLRIAPPEAPTTGYMFGKGIYFADMVSKSANYCFTSPNNSTGLMLLCEVALGNMLECNQAKYIEKLPKDKQSCKGLGRTHPNPKDSVTLPNGVEVPVGKGVSTDSKNTALLYNEYIVYDVAQVNMKYLLKLDFKYNY